MKLTFLATGQAPDSYEINGETITAHQEGLSETIDLSPLGEGDKFEGLELEALTLNPSQVLREATREGGELHVTLCQASPMRGHWRESEIIDSEDYISGHRYIRELVDGVLIPAPKIEVTHGED